jgi:hypothetical protein
LIFSAVNLFKFFSQNLCLDSKRWLLELQMLGMQEMKQACSYLNVADYRLFSMALTQRYISPLKVQ